MGPRIRRFAILAAGNLLVFVALILVVEFSAARCVTRPAGNTVPHSRLNHTWKPNATKVHAEWVEDNPDFPEPYVHHYNSQGWLERYDVSRRKPPNIYRIFYLGDSFTEGTCAMEASVPSLVEAQINERISETGWRVEVVNTGTSSYSPTLFYLLFRHELLRYEPDLIVVNVDMTDAFDDWKYAQALVVDDQGDPVAAPPRALYSAGFLETEAGIVLATPWRRMVLFLYRNSHTFNWVLGLTRGSRAEARVRGGPEQAGEIDRWSWCRHRWDDSARRNVARTLNMLRRLIHLSQENGVAVMLTAAPHFWQYARSTDGGGPPAWSARPHYVLANLAQQLGVPYLNSYEALAPHIQGTQQTRFSYAGDVHFHPRGYAIWADAQSAFLADPGNGLLPEHLAQAAAP
jgi:lysophospholipase L1-like esterase